MSISQIIKISEEKMLSSLLEGKTLENFVPGDTVAVKLKIVDGATERYTTFEGICIAKTNRRHVSRFTVRKISAGVGIERTFFLYSPLVSAVTVIRQGVVRRAKLNYLKKIKGNVKIKAKFTKKK